MVTTVLDSPGRVGPAIAGRLVLTVAVAVVVALSFGAAAVALTDPVTATPVPLAGLGIAGAVVLSRWRPSWATAVLIIDGITVLGPATDRLDQVHGIPGAAVLIGAFLGVCWVMFALGTVIPLWSSVLWLGIWSAVVWWLLDVDVPLLMFSIGWWTAGQAVGSHQRLVEELRQRTEDLLREHERFAAEAVRLTRAQIARELHDVVAHAMTVIVIQARAGQQLVDHDAAATREALDAIVASTNEAKEDINALVALMEPAVTRPLTRPLLDELVDRARRTGTDVELSVDGDPETLAPGVAVVLHRAVQEALTNAFRYAPGSPITVRLAAGLHPQLEVVNGPAATDGLRGLGAGRGLTGLQERLGGTGLSLSWGPTTEGGWRVGLS